MSIQRQLILLIVATITLASFFSAIHGYKNSMKQLDSIFDRELSSIAQLIISTTPITLNKVSNTNNKNSKKITLATAENNQLQLNQQNIDHSLDLIYQVYFQNQLIKKSKLAPEQSITTLSHGFSNNNFNGKRWRTYVLTHNLTDEQPHKKNDEQNEIKVMVAHPISHRISSAESILFVTITPIVFSIPLIALIIFYFVRKSLKPLRTLSKQLTGKSMDDLTPVFINETPQELTPVITRLNHLFQKLDHAFEREKQLTANAAHELRTPVSVLTLTAHNILQDYQQNQLTLSQINELQNNVARMAHVAEQIIALYRYSPENFQHKKHSVDIEEVLQAVISDSYNEISTQQQSIELNATSLFIHGERFALFTLFENLLKNAIKYSGNSANILIGCVIKNELLEVTVEDSGAGVDDTQLKHIFERFYRASNQQGQIKGAGLGLSIVKHIVDLHYGSVKCQRSTLGGLAITISLPIKNDNNTSAISFNNEI